MLVIGDGTMSTIAAIATPIGQGGIGIIRISGEKALEAVQAIFQKKKGKATWKSYQMQYGVILDQGEVVDEVLVSYFQAPHSYTGEDVCEINCHGGRFMMQRILELVLQQGARLAEPGEFTKRAFLNGKLDLSQAEAVMDVIQSKSQKESRISMQQLEGHLGQKMKEIKSRILEAIVDLEASIDYPEYDIEEVKRSSLETLLQQAEEELTALIQSFESGKRFTEGICTVIVGKPNVGKSSLLNALLKEDRAIVTEIAGTTRDTIEENMILQGIPLRIMDTAGIHQTEDCVEEIGVQRSKQAMKEADLILFVLDVVQGITEEDREIYRTMQQLCQEDAKKQCLLVYNKIDQLSSIEREQLEQQIRKELGDEKGKDTILMLSTKTEEGLEQIGLAVETMFQLQQIDVNNEIVVIDVRHKEALVRAKEAITEARKVNQAGIPMDMISIQLQTAIQNIGEITGETVSEEVIQGIFQKFCLGK